MQATAQTHYLCSDLKQANGKPWGIKSTARFSRNSKPRGAVVFVHGFRGAAEVTWRSFPDLLSASKQNVFAEWDLYFWGYNSFQPAADSVLELKAFLRKLHQNPFDSIIEPSHIFSSTRNKGFQYVDFAICAHSLGAIVSRLALLELATSTKPISTIGKTRLLLFAPAHMGSDIIKLVSTALTGIQLPIGPLVLGGQLLETFLKARFPVLLDLESGSQTILDLRDDAKELLQANPNLYAFLNAHVVHGRKDKIVKKNRFVKDHDTQMVDADHVGICKSSPTNETNFVRELLRVLK